MSDRQVSTDALATLGTVIDETQKRDAIHLAVIPAVAQHALRPGDHVTKDGYCMPPGKGVGIVDPFLTQPLKAGERFWLVIYPRVITSLRHVWAHPEFDDEASPVAVVDEDRASSEEWLRSFVGRADCPSYEVLMKIIAGSSASDDSDIYDGPIRAQNDGEYLTIIGRDAGGRIPSEFWDHIEVVTGQKYPRAEYFSCSC